MELLYSQEHQNCDNYKSEAPSPVQLMGCETGEIIDLSGSENHVIFVITGKIGIGSPSLNEARLTVENARPEVAAKHLFLVAPGSEMSAFAIEKSTLLICKLGSIIQICDQYSLAKLYTEVGYNTSGLSLLPFNERIETYLAGFIPCIEDGIMCSHYFVAKFAELFTLLRCYYKKEELAAFFSVLLNADTDFENFVWKNYRNAKNVTAFADMGNYSVSTFKVKFRTVFKMPAIHWMIERKKEDVLHELRCSTKSFKEIAWDYHFASVSHLTNFCRQRFGKTPSEIRSNTEE